MTFARVLILHHCEENRNKWPYW